jgi:hypothetical protein
VGGADERVRLWVDNVLLLDQWSSLSRAKDWLDARPLSLTSSTAYAVRMEYAQRSGTFSAALAWSSATSRVATAVSGSSIFAPHAVGGAPFSARVLPAALCAAASQVRAQ